MTWEIFKRRPMMIDVERHELHHRLWNVVLRDRANTVIEEINRQLIYGFMIPSHLLFDEKEYQRFLAQWQRDGEELAALTKRLSEYRL